MVYGYYNTDSAGNKTVVAEGCMYCQMSTVGQHESNCPMREVVIGSVGGAVVEVTDVNQPDSEPHPADDKTSAKDVAW